MLERWIKKIWHALESRQELRDRLAEREQELLEIKVAVISARRFLREMATEPEGHEAFGVLARSIEVALAKACRPRTVHFDQTAFRKWYSDGVNGPPMTGNP
jgi:hypothetical protein